MKFSIFLTLLCCISSALCATVELGTCYLKGTTADSTISGTVKFTLISAGQVQVDAAITGITVNTGADHGMHIHQYGDISDGASASTGGHWNPANVAHACPPTATRHMGDMGLWTVAANGTLTQSKTLDLITLTGATSIIGHAVVLHANPDDCTTQPTGNSGTKIAHCVIGVADPGVNNTNSAKLDDDTLTSAVCVLSAASSSSAAGLVILTETSATAPVRIQAFITGITGTHGFHIHSWGDISAATGTAAGSHYNPLNAPHHGIPPYPVRHMGDLGNIHYYNTTDGAAYYDFTNDKLRLNGEYSIMGRTMIIHSLIDDCSTPIGNSGSRIAQCVIGVKNPATTKAFPADVPVDQDISDCQALYTLPNTNPTVAPSTTSDMESSDSFASVNSVAFGVLALALLFVALF